VIFFDSLDVFASFVQQDFVMQQGNSFYITCINRPQWLHSWMWRVKTRLRVLFWKMGISLIFSFFYIFLMCVGKVMMLLDVLFWLSWLKNENLYLLFLHAESAGVRRVSSECELISYTPVWKMLCHFLRLWHSEMGQFFSFPRLWLNIWLLRDF
jgi:hypothetical protein